MDEKSDLAINIVSLSTTNAIQPPTFRWHTKQRLTQTLIRITSNCEIGHFRISMSMSAQALLWKNLVNCTVESRQQNDDHPLLFHLLHNKLPPIALILFWSLTLTTLAVTCLVYGLKCVLCFDQVKAEFTHQISVNYFFAPWISSLLLLQSFPFTINSLNNDYYVACWWVFVVPIIVLDVKIYGEWLTKGKRFLSKVANPSSQLSIVANFVAAEAVEERWREWRLCLFSIGIVHYIVLFVTLYQRLPSGDGFPTRLRPVFFLFVATPSMASLAWSSVNGGFDTVSKMLFFLSLFLFLSLTSRPGLLKKSMKKFNVAWWSYSFALTLLALASFEYAGEVKETVARALMLLLSLASILLLFLLMLFTIFNAPYNLTS